MCVPPRLWGYWFRTDSTVRIREKKTGLGLNASAMLAQSVISADFGGVGFFYFYL